MFPYKGDTPFTNTYYTYNKTRSRGLVIKSLCTARLVPRASVCSCLPMNEDIETILRDAKNVRLPHQRGSMNPLSSLPEPKAKIKQAIKERIRLLAGAYISLSGFVDDDDIRFAEANPKLDKTKAIYKKVLDDMEMAQKEIREFKIIDQE